MWVKLGNVCKTNQNICNTFFFPYVSFLGSVFFFGGADRKNI